MTDNAATKAIASKTRRVRKGADLKFFVKELLPVMAFLSKKSWRARDDLSIWYWLSNVRARRCSSSVFTHKAGTDNPQLPEVVS